KKQWRQERHNKLLSSATRQEREQREVQRLLRIQHFIIYVVGRGATSHGLDVLAHTITISIHHHIREHRHLFLRFRIFQQQDRIGEIKIQLVLIEHMKRNQVVSFET